MNTRFVFLWCACFPFLVSATTNSPDVIAGWPFLYPTVSTEIKQACGNGFFPISNWSHITDYLDLSANSTAPACFVVRETLTAVHQSIALGDTNGRTLAFIGGSGLSNIFVFENYTDATLQNVYISSGNNSAACILVEKGSTLSITNSMLGNCINFRPFEYTRLFGGAVFANQSSRVYVTNSTIHDSYSLVGGAVVVRSDSHLWTRNSLFVDNDAGFYGGALFAEYGSGLDVDTCQFVRNDVISGSGGGVWLHYAFLHIKDSVINESVTSSGSAIGGVQCRVTMSDCDLCANNASLIGGAIAVVDNSEINITGATRFIDNFAASAGGGLAVLLGSVANVGGATLFKGGAASFGGGAFVFNTPYLATQSYLNVTDNVSFIDNEAFSGGGAVAALSGTFDTIVTVHIHGGPGRGVIFAGNHARAGGAINLGSSGTVMSSSGASYFNNTASDIAGAILVWAGASLRATDSVFFGNYVKLGSAGAIAILNSEFPSVNAEIKGCSFTGNWALFQGGTVLIAGAMIDMDSTTIKNSSALTGGCVPVSQEAAMSITRSSFLHGRASVNGGCINMDLSSRLSVLQSTFEDCAVDYTEVSEISILMDSGIDGSIAYLNAFFDVGVASQTYYGWLGAYYVICDESCDDLTKPNITKIAQDSRVVQYGTLDNKLTASSSASLVVTLASSAETSFDISLNQIEIGGGALSMTTGSSAFIEETLFSHCTSSVHGGGIMARTITLDEQVHVKITNSTFIRSEADFYGAFLFNFMSNLTAHGVALLEGSSLQSSFADNLGGSMSCKSRCGLGTYGSCSQVGDCYSCDGSCTECGVGTYLATSGAVNEDECVKCPVGYAINVTGAKECTLCPAGRYASNRDQTTGSGVGVSEGGERCDACPANTYSPDSGATGCIQCPSDVTSEAGSSSCDLCFEGDYWDEAEGNGTCVSCPGQARCHGDGYLPMPRRMYWVDRDSPSYAGSLYACGTPSCKGAVLQQRQPQGGGDACWKRSNASEYYSPAAKGGRCDSDALQCREGSEGPLCGSCSNGYYLFSSSQGCQRCGGRVLVSFIPMLVCLAGMLGYALYTVTSPGSLRSSTSSGSRGAVKVLFTLFQILSFVNVDVDLPGVMSELAEGFEFIQVSTPWECFSGYSSYVTRVYVTSLLPILSVGAIWIVFFARALLLFVAAKDRHRHHSQQWRRDSTAITDDQDSDDGGTEDSDDNGRTTTTTTTKADVMDPLYLRFSQHSAATLFLLYLMFPTVSVTQFRGLDCLKLSKTSGKSYLRFDTSVSCDTDRYGDFFTADLLFISLYQSSYLLFAYALWSVRQRLNPSSIADSSTRLLARDRDTSLAPLAFLFEDYRCETYYFELIDMVRRQCYIAGSALIRNAETRVVAGLLFSLLCVSLFHNLKPYRAWTNNVLAEACHYFLAALFFGMLLIEAGFLESIGLSEYLLGILLVCAVATITALALVQGLLDEGKTRRAREAMMIRPSPIEDSTGFSSTKFRTTLAQVREGIPASSELVYFYCSEADAQAAAKAGIPALTDYSGVPVTLLGPAELLEGDRQKNSKEEEGLLATTPPRSLPFSSFEVCLCLAVPRDALVAVEDDYNDNDNDRGGGMMTLLCVPAALLSALSPKHHSMQLQEPEPWLLRGYLILSPACIVRSYRLDATRLALRSNDDEDDEERSTSSMSKSYGHLLRFTGASHDVSLLSTSSLVGQQQHQKQKKLGSFFFPQASIAVDRTMGPITTAMPEPEELVSVQDYLTRMETIRQACDLAGLLPLFHFTAPHVAPLIISGGLRMSTQGQGDGGVYLSLCGPASYGIGSTSYERSLIVDCFGKERLQEYLGKGKLELCIIYASDPISLHPTPGGRRNAVMVRKATFSSFSLLASDGSYYLRPDRIVGMFVLRQQALLLHTTLDPTTRLRLRHERACERSVADIVNPQESVMDVIDRRSTVVYDDVSGDLPPPPHGSPRVAPRRISALARSPIVNDDDDGNSDDEGFDQIYSAQQETPMQENRPNRDIAQLFQRSIARAVEMTSSFQNQMRASPDDEGLATQDSIGV